MVKTRLVRLLSHAKKYIIYNIIWQWIALLMQIVTVFSIAGLLEKVIFRAADADSILRTAALLVISAVVRYLCDRMAARASYAASVDVKRILRERIYEKLLRLGASYREQTSTSEVVQMSAEGVEQLEIYFGKYLPQFFYSLLAPVTLFLVLMRVNLKASVVLLVCVPLIPLSIVAVQKFAKKLLNKYWGIYTGLGDSFLENLQGLTTLKIYQADEQKSEEMDVEAQNFRRITMKVLTMQLNSTSVMDIIAYGGAAIGMIVAGSEFLSGRLDFAGALAIILLASEFFIPLRLLGSFFHIAMNGMAASDKIFRLLDLEEPEAGTETLDGIMTGDRTPDITLADVHFAYTPREANEEVREVLRGISLELPAAGFISLVGESGCGKSTIAGLIAGKNRGYQGKIEIAGKELRNIQETELMRHITLVRHNSYLFKGTVEDNLLMAKPDATEEEMKAVLRKVNLWAFLDTQDGLRTRLTEKAGNLSGGQCQRLALARALLHDTPVYIFDEATSNIDAESEELIMDVIRELAGTKTVLLISHRLSNVVGSDCIYMLANGEIRESGTHEELLRMKGRYYHLYESQRVLEEYAEHMPEKSCQSVPEEYAEHMPEKSCQRAEEDVEHMTEKSCQSVPEEYAEHVSEKSCQRAEAKCTIDGASVNRESMDHINEHHADDIREHHTDHIQQGRSRRGALKIMGQLIGLVKPLIHIMLCAIVLGVAGYLCAIFLTILAGQTLLGEVFGGKIGILMAVLAVSRGVLHYIEQYCNHFIAFKLLAIIRHKVFAALRRLCPAKLEGRDKGNLISIITTDIELLEVFYAHTISPIAIALLTSLVMVIFIGHYHVLAGIFALAAYGIVGILIPLWNGKRGGQKGMEFRDAFGELNSFVLDSLRGLDETIQYGQGEERKSQIDQRSKDLGTMQKELSRLEGAQRSVTNLTILVCSFGMLFLMLGLYRRGAVGFDGLLTCTIAMMGSFGPVVALSSLSNNLNQTLACAERVLSILEEEPLVEEVADDRIVNGESAVDCEKAGGYDGHRHFKGAAAEHVTFAYEDEVILKDYSLSIAPGTIVGIHGVSGSGKSTLLKLLMRFWDVQQGRVTVSQEAVDKIPTARLRDTESYVTQETHLFHDSIANNIAIGRKGASREEIMEAAKKASIHEFIMTLPKGYDTEVGELGDTLSGGEKQRIGIARAFLHDAPFLLLDEPTSNLDSLNEGIILRSLKETCDTKTVLLVSHRKSTMNLADVVFEMENGRLS